jgi:hypothetical protein
MSVQLVLYPQSYNGGVNDISYSSTEVLVNGINFWNLPNTSSFDSSVPLNQSAIDDSISNNYPATLNTWYRFRTTTGGTPALPTATSNDLVLNSIATINVTGIYQRVSNVIVGQNYTVTVNISTPSTGTVNVNIHDGVTSFSTGAAAASGSVVTHTFTATTPTPIIVISRAAGTASNLTISSISVLPTGTAPTLENGQVIVDLYEDEDIPLTLSVDNFKNAAEKVQSYSKAFTLPATKRNNQIFDNVFSITRTAQGNISFNPYLKTQCELKEDGFILFEGYLRLIDVEDKEGEISYNVNLYSSVTSLADVLKDRTFMDIDFSELTHSFNKDNIKATWYDTGSGPNFLLPSTSGFRDANDTLKYPFVDWTRQIPISNGASGIAGYPQLINLSQAFRPFLQVKYLIDRIFNEPNFPFSYSSAFFDTDDFKKLYMDFNWGGDDEPANAAAQSGNFQTGVWTSYTDSGPHQNAATTTYTPLELVYDTILGLWVMTYDPPVDQQITSTVVNESYYIEYEYKIKNYDTVTRTVECQWLYTPVGGAGIPINYSGVISLAAGQVFTFTGVLTQVMPTIGDTLGAQFRCDSGTVDKVRQEELGLDASAVVYLIAAVGTIGNSSTYGNLIFQMLRGDTGQWEFLKGLFTMFNLITMPDPSNPNNIIIEPYDDIFLNNSDSTQLNWTDKIDVSQMKLTPLTELNKKTIFKFVEDDDDYPFNNYKLSVQQHLYGSKIYSAEITTGPFQTIFEGTEEIVAEPFAATIVKPYEDIWSDFITPAIYAYNSDDNTSEGFDNSPRIMYNNGRKDTGITYYIPAQNGLSSENQSHYLQFSHLSDIPTVSTARDFHFGECQLIPPIGAPTTNNLFNLYWLPYFAELYNADTRTMTIKVKLTAGDIASFNFYDTVLIKNREFRVNKIDYKPNDLATVEFILIP